MAKNLKTSPPSIDDRIPELPQVLLQHIQNYLSPKQATQTIILSKAWLNAWSNNRSNIDFDEELFKGTKDDFLSLLNTTLKGYHDQKFLVKSFRLSLSNMDSEYDSLLDKWIPTLVRHMGIQSFHLTISRNTNAMYYLPHSIFEAESIIELSLGGCWLGDHNVKVMMFKHLKVLKLNRVYIKGITFKKIISRCGLIEDIELVHCEGLNCIKLNDLQYLKKFNFVGNDDAPFTLLWDSNPGIEWGVTNLESIKICRCTNWFQVHKFKVFPNLKYLSLARVRLYGISSYDLTSYFPVLEDLILDHCSGFDQIQIQHDSIQHLTLRFTNGCIIKGHINTPSLRSFRYSGNNPSIISFAKTYSKWESDIELNFHYVSLLPSVNEMLRELSESEISVKISYSCLENQHNNDIVDYKPAWEVERLLLSTFEENKSVVNDLFRTHHPKIVDVQMKMIKWQGKEMNLMRM